MYWYPNRLEHRYLGRTCHVKEEIYCHLMKSVAVFSIMNCIFWVSIVVGSTWIVWGQRWCIDQKAEIAIRIHRNLEVESYV